MFSVLTPLVPLVSLVVTLTPLVVPFVPLMATLVPLVVTLVPLVVSLVLLLVPLVPLVVPFVPLIVTLVPLVDDDGKGGGGYLSSDTLLRGGSLKNFNMAVGSRSSASATKIIIKSPNLPTLVRYVSNA